MIRTLGAAKIEKHCPKCGSLLDETGKCPRHGIITEETKLAKRMKGTKLTKRMKVLILIVLLLAASTSTFVIYNNYIHHHWESLNFAGMERRYLINIPPGYDDTKPVPLVIVLHGYGESPTMVESESDFSKKSDAEGFIVVYPEGYGSPNEGSWNVQFGFGPALSENIDDVGFIRALIDSLQGKFAIDGNRIYVAGFSNGAIMAYRLAAELSDRIAAAAPVEGTIGGRANTDSPLIMIREPTQPVSIIVFQGTADNPLYSGGSFILVSPSGLRFNVTELSVNESVSFWVKADGCSDVPRIEELSGSPHDMIKYTYSGGAKGKEVTLFKVIGGVHEWPVGTTDEIWTFFKNHPKNG